MFPVIEQVLEDSHGSLWNNISAPLSTTECLLWTQTMASGTGSSIASVPTHPYSLPVLTSKPQSPLNSLPCDKNSILRSLERKLSTEVEG